MMNRLKQIMSSVIAQISVAFVGMLLTLGYSNIVKLLVEISVLKHAKYIKTVTSKCEIVI